MSNVYFISDLHFGHNWMAKHRGFNSAEEHDDHIIEMWNKRVNKKDTVYILGDVTMEDKDFIFKLGKLKGNKIVIGGNHDLKRDTKEILAYASSVVGMVDYRGYTLTHCPIHPEEVSFYRGNIHGHTHEKYMTTNGDIDPRYINVCCENINYTPISLDEVIAWQRKFDNHEDK